MRYASPDFFSEVLMQIYEPASLNLIKVIVPNRTVAAHLLLNIIPDVVLSMTRRVRR